VVDGDFWVYTDGLNVHYEVIQSGNSAFSWFYRMTGIIYSIYTVYIYIHGILCNIYIYIYIYACIYIFGGEWPATASLDLQLRPG